MSNAYTVSQLKRFEKTRRAAMQRVIARIVSDEERLGEWPRPLKAAATRRRLLERYRAARADHAHAVIELQRHGVTGLEFLP